MINEKLKALIKMLTVKTQKKQAIWNKASGNNQFKLLLPNNIAVTVEFDEGDYNNAETYMVSIYNDNGDVIQRYSTDDKTPKEDLSLVQEFHQSASDVYYKVDETFDALLNSVKGQDVIGEIEKTQPGTAPPPSDDDLPF